MLTLGQIKETTCSPTACAQKFMDYINQTCEKFNINTPIRQLCFLAQVGHESGSLYFTEELASGAAYEGRKSLGNAVGEALGIDLIRNPVLLGGKNVSKCSNEQLKNAAMSAGWYWNSRRLNNIADTINMTKPIDTGTNLANFILITKRINGGINGLHDRLNRFKAGVKFF